MKDNLSRLPPDLRTLYTSKGVLFRNDQRLRTFSLNILYTNAEELINTAEKLHDPDVGAFLFGDRDQEASTQAHREFKRHLHNFVAAAMTVVEHNRVMLRERYKDQEILSEITQKIAQTVGTSTTCKFVQDLRNYMVHKGLPNSSMHQSFTNNGDDTFRLEVGIKLPTADLLDYNWKSGAKKYIESCGEYVEILKLVNDYLEEIKEFNDWLENTLENHHKEDLIEAQKLIDAQESSPSSHETVAPTDEASPAPESSIKEVVDLAANAISSKIKKINMPEAQAEPFKSERIAAAIFDDGGLQNIIISGTDDVGEDVIVFIRNTQGHYGLPHKELSALDDIFQSLKNEEWADQKFAQDFVTTAFIDWARSTWSNQDETSFYEHLKSSAASEVKDFDVYYPIANLEIETAFEFGPVIVSPMTEDIFDSIEESIALPPGKDYDNFKKRISHLRKNFQGLASIRLAISAHPSIIQTRGYSIASEAVDILRFFAPRAPYANSRCPISLKGAEHIPTENIIAIAKNSLFNYEGVREEIGEYWKLSEASLMKLIERGLGEASTLIMPQKLSDFSAHIKSAIKLFSRGCTALSPADRLRYTLSSAEEIFLRNSFEHAESLVPRRVSNIINVEPSQRAQIKDHIAKAYFLKNSQQESYSPREKAALLECTRAIHHAIMLALLNLSSFTHKSNFIGTLESLSRKTPRLGEIE
ncbi:hypothetical protein QC590_10870 [Pseudomonas putida]|uniref:hypothetical protein n=1 Tax=Pseudomonas putida TaxID=303 RepID=UPI00334A8082